MSREARISGHALRALLPDLSRVAGLKYGVLMGAIHTLVLDARIAIGTRLPSERELAEVLGVSRATVTAAYDGLRQDGYLTSRSGSGSFVTLPPQPRERPIPNWAVSGVSWPVGRLDREPIDLTMAALPAPPAVVTDALAIASTELPAHVYTGGGYDTVGLPVLREAVAARFSVRGVPTAPEQILVTNGALHGLDLLLRLLVGPGDRVLTELPSYPAALDAVRASAGRLLPVPMALAGGWDVAQMEAVLRQGSPKLAYLIPDFHNPTGALVGDQDREQVLGAARRVSTTVVVDETFLGLGFLPDATPAAAIDPTVITIGSISKSVWGGLRIGWLRAPAELVQRLAALRARIDLGSPVIDQLVGAQLIGQLDSILAQRAEELTSKRDALRAALGRSLPDWRLPDPDGGLALWIELDEPVSTPLTLLARSAGISIVPGSRFGIDGTLERFVRLPYTHAPDLLREVARRLAAVWNGLDRSQRSGGQILVA